MTRYSHRSAGRQGGASAVELALILPILVAMLGAPLTLAVYYWHYTAVQKASHDAARFLSTVPEAELRNPTLALAARAIATDIIQAELSELGSRGNDAKLTFLCGQVNQCDGLGEQATPQTITAGIQFEFRDTIFNKIDTGRYGWTIMGVATVRYAGK